MLSVSDMMHLLHLLVQILWMDRSSGTVVGASSLGKEVMTSWGLIFAAESILPVLSPCLAASALSREHFSSQVSNVMKI